MLTRPSISLRAQRGTTMMELLVTLLILAFGLIGLAGLQSKMQLGTLESYQRAQAIVLLGDMQQRLVANQANAANFVQTGTLGTGTADADCSAMPTGVNREKCEWSNALKGAAEASSGGTKVGAMVDARGCIVQIQAPDPTPNVCKPGIYQVSVTWQGMHALSSLENTNNVCGSGLYGNDQYRRVISGRVVVPLLTCQ